MPYSALNPPPNLMPRDFGTQSGLYGAARDIETEERRRYDVGMTGLDSAFADFQKTMSGGIRKDLLLSQAADATGLRGRQMMDRMRSNLGARGIDPNSGAASGMLARLGMQMDNANIGAMRDIDIADSQQRALNAGQLFSGALNLFQARTSPVSGALADMGLNVAEMNQAGKSLQAQERMQDKANRTNILSGILGGGLGLLGRMAA